MDQQYDGLRSFLATCEELGEVRVIKGADWDLEIGALTEAASELIDEPPALLFDEIKGYPKGFRVLSLSTGSRIRTALFLRLPLDMSRMEIVRTASRRIKDATPIPPVVVPTGPVMQNVMRDGDVDMLKFPVLRSHPQDGGRYIGTGCTLLNRDPETGYVNMGTYRMQVHEPNLLGLWQSPGQQGRLIAERYWKMGKACPVVATFGGDPLIFTFSYIKFAWGDSELDRIGGMLGQPLEIIAGPLTGLPIPAHCEVAIEGEIPPPSEQTRDEGPFGEWTGYYTGTRENSPPQPVIRVKAVYYRNDPILLNMAPQWPGAPTHGVRFDSGILWGQLEAAGVPGITGVYTYNPFMVVVAIKQLYAGHAQQAGMAVLGAAAAARNGRFVVVVDDDIDPSNMDEVIWAMTSRVDPASDIHTVNNCWASPLDPRMPPELGANGPHVNARAIFYAVRPWQWRDKFPIVNRFERSERDAVVKKFRDLLPFPPA
jgi:4-hydroxy-3-polyprenylbenzoate decarboxylase